ncbi:MAG: HAD family hydrolase [Desulfobulbus sp.]
MKAGHPPRREAVPWERIDTVLFDMDGTLLDRHFDDYFWEQYLPEHYSLSHDLPIAEARIRLLARYRSVRDTLAWADLDFWSRELELDLPELKQRIASLIAVRPGVPALLAHCRDAGKRLFLVTNAHHRSLALKLRQTALAPWFDRIVCAQEVGVAKEEPVFWPRLQTMLAYDPRQTLLVDDSEQVLRSACRGGPAYLLFVAKPSSRRPARHSTLFPSIESFREILP